MELSLQIFADTFSLSFLLSMPMYFHIHTLLMSFGATSQCWVARDTTRMRIFFCFVKKLLVDLKAELQKMGEGKVGGGERSRKIDLTFSG